MTGADPSERRPLVLQLVKGLDAGGTETLLLLAARHRDRTRFREQVAYLLPHHVALLDDLAREGVAATCIGGTPWWDPRWLVRLRRTLRRDHVDLVHVHSPLLAAGARVVVRTLPRRERPALVVTLHNMWASHHPAVRLVDRLTQWADDRRLAVSDAVRRSLPGRSGRRTVTRLHGIEVAELRARADRDGVRAELGVADDEVLVGTVANLRSNKAYPDLLAAAATVAAARPDVRFVAVGQGPLHDELVARRDELGLGGRFRFLGYRADATRLVSGLDVFCLSSHHEGLPLALMEALALGVPVVVTDVGGVGELVTDGVQGSLVPPAHPELLAAALLDLAADPAARRARAEAARAAGDALDAAPAVAAIEAHYLQLLATPPDEMA